MGAVYEAADERLGRQVAVKELLVEGEDLRRAFEREARLLANLSHASLPRVIDHFSEGGGQYLVMDYVPGEDLKHMIEGRGAPFPTAEVLLWADQLLEVLEYLHGHEPPVIHRDIKPSNLKLSGSRRIMLLDFGLAKGGQGTAATLSRSVFGYSPHFASLEQTQGEKSTPRSDLYSLSATLYYLLTAKVPPDALTRATAVFDEEADPLALVGELNPEVPERVAQVIMSGLELRTSARPPSASAMRSALRGEIPHQPAGVTDEVTRVASKPLYSKVAPGDTSEVIGDGRVVAMAEPTDGVSGKWAGDSTAPSRSTYMKAAGLLLILAAVASVGYMWLTSRAPGKPVTSSASVPPPNTELPQQFKPAAAALVGITLKDAEGHVLAEGDGFFVTRDEAIVPLAVIEGASLASVTPRGTAHTSSPSQEPSLRIQDNRYCRWNCCTPLAVMRGRSMVTTWRKR